MRGATRGSFEERILHNISIHAPHAGCDYITRKDNMTGMPISIHAPHAGCDAAALFFHAFHF